MNIISIHSNLVKKNISGFTLVELIVIMTILVILITLGFISIQNHIQDARNSKIVNDVSVLSSAISRAEIKRNIPLANLVASGTSRVNINGVTGSFANGMPLGPSTYGIGYVDFQELKQGGTNIADTEGQQYIYTYATEAGKIYYQVGGEIAQPSGENKIIIKGNYVQEDPGTDVESLVSISGSIDPVINGTYTTGSLY